MIVARPHNPAEPDLLTGHANAPLSFMSGDTPGTELQRVEPPASGWTHEALEEVNTPASASWNAYLGPTWVGSSEV
jgi:hypothetical protein